jgi:hypothetical protein
VDCAGGCIDVEDALAFVDGTLPAARRAQVEQRIDACARCREIVAEAARADDASDVATAAREAPTVSERRAKRRALGTATASLEPGARVGRYVIERPIGAGGMGVVCLARDPELRRAVVVKLVRVDAFPDESREALELRMRREAQAMAQLSHPNVVQIFDIGQHGDRVFLAMEYIPGQTLDAWVVERTRTRDEILAMFGQAGAGLAAAHRAGLVHRDFKPANVLVSSDGVAKVTDFGLARGLGTPQVQRAPAPRTSGVHAVLTHADAVVGTPAYMAPEQAEGRAVDARSDQYAFALALVDALVGQSAANRTVHADGEVDAALAKAGLLPRQRAAIVRALASDPAGRFEAMPPLLAAIVPASARRTWPILVGVGLCAAAVALWFLTRPEPAKQCIADAPRAWPAAVRAQLVETFARSPRAFDSWTGESVAAAIDRAVERLSVDEISTCNGTTVIDPGCLASRSRALGVAARATPASDPWPLVAAIDDCPPRKPADAIARIRRELAASPGATRLEALAVEARDVGDPRLAADAYELAARDALASRQYAIAQRLALVADNLGDSTNDAAIRGRAALILLALARVNANADAATDVGNRLRSIQSRQRPDPRADHAISIVEGDVFGELGDHPRAARAWDRAIAAARTPDERLHAHVGRAWQHHLQLDDAKAKAGLDAAIAGGKAASKPAQAAAFTTLGTLALATGDGKAARHAFATAGFLDPALASTFAHRVRLAEARALAGEVDPALAELEAAGSNATERALASLATVRVLRRASRAAEAKPMLKTLATQVIIQYDHRGTADFALSVLERIEIAFEQCALAVDTGGFVYCESDLAKGLPETAPIRMRLLAEAIRDAQRTNDPTLLGKHERWAAILDKIGAPPLVAAELHWQLARDESRPATPASSPRSTSCSLERRDVVPDGRHHGHRVADLAEIGEHQATSHVELARAVPRAERHAEVRVAAARRHFTQLLREPEVDDAELRDAVHLRREDVAHAAEQRDLRRRRRGFAAEHAVGLLLQVLDEAGAHGQHELRLQRHLEPRERTDAEAGEVSPTAGRHRDATVDPDRLRLLHRDDLVLRNGGTGQREHQGSNRESHRCLLAPSWRAPWSRGLAIGRMKKNRATKPGAPAPGAGGRHA